MPVIASNRSVFCFMDASLVTPGTPPSLRILAYPEVAGGVGAGVGASRFEKPTVAPRATGAMRILEKSVKMR